MIQRVYSLPDGASALVAGLVNSLRAGAVEIGRERKFVLASSRMSEVDKFEFVTALEGAIERARLSPGSINLSDRSVAQAVSEQFSDAASSSPRHLEQYSEARGRPVAWLPNLPGSARRIWPP